MDVVVACTRSLLSDVSTDVARPLTGPSIDDLQGVHDALSKVQESVYSDLVSALHAVTDGADSAARTDRLRASFFDASDVVATREAGRVSSAAAEVCEEVSKIAAEVRETGSWLPFTLSALFRLVLCLAPS